MAVPRISLVVVAGPHEGKEFVFSDHDTFMVGRSDRAHFSLPGDHYFSRWHFLVEVNPPQCQLLDMNSHNGTFVNSRRVERCDLGDGDEIQAGTTRFKVKIEGSSTETGAGPGVSTRTLPPSTLSLPWMPNEKPTKETQPLPDIPGYRLLEELGRGGMGIVFRAERRSDGAAVAVKTILPKVHPQPESLKRFLREVKILESLRHRHIVAFRDSGEADGLLYFAMDFVPGTDAAKLVQAEGPLPVPRALRLALQAFDALAYAHDLGYVHRDIKPGNILVTGIGADEEIRVADFGLARSYQASPMSGLTMSGVAAGTPQFMPPEQILDFRSVTPAADQYALAATLYFLLAGKPHFEKASSQQDMFRRILQEEPIPLRQHRSDLPEGLAERIHRAMSRKTEDRFPSVRAFAEALRPFGAD